MRVSVSGFAVRQADTCLFLLQMAAAKAAGNELAKLSEELEDKSMRWLELAELAGDL